MLRISDERVREAKAQTCRQDFDRLCFKDVESVKEFSLRLSTIANDLATHGDPVDEHKVVKKFLRVVPPKFWQMASAIASLLDRKHMSIEELTG
jgi:hypothetical protein